MTGTSNSIAVDSCTDITRPGTYELTSDIQAGSDQQCIHVRADDVVLDGNGYTISGTSTPGSTGILVYGAAPGEPTTPETSLSNVTVRNVEVTDWEDGIRIGDMHGRGTRAQLQDVFTRNNLNEGIELTEVEGTELDDVTATGNEFGITLWEAHAGTFTDLTVTDNERVGLYLAQEVSNNTFRNVHATRNGPVGYMASGVYLSDDATRNLLTNVYTADNDGAGLRFADSYRNTVRDAVSESNTGPGIIGTPARGESLVNVTVRNNGGPELQQPEGHLSARSIRLGTSATLTFDSEPVTLDPVDSASLPGGLPGRPVVDNGVDVTGIDTRVDVTFSYDGADVDESSLELWRHDGREWVQVADAAVDESADTIAGTVTGSGIVIPIATSGDESPDDTTTDTGTTGLVGDRSTFVIRSTTDGPDFEYEFTVDGEVVRTETETVAADSTDDIVENDDGTVTVRGSTGDREGDAYRVTGEILSFETAASASEYELEFEGEDVTDELSDGDSTEPADGTEEENVGGDTTPSTFVIRSTTDGPDFEYEFTVDGTVARTETETVAADSGDRIIGNDDGTVTVRGSTGDREGDAYRVTGEILSFDTTASESEYELELDGEDVTDEFAGSITASETPTANRPGAPVLVAGDTAQDRERHPRQREASSAHVPDGLAV